MPVNDSLAQRWRSARTSQILCLSHYLVATIFCLLVPSSYFIVMEIQHICMLFLPISLWLFLGKVMAAIFVWDKPHIKFCDQSANSTNKIIILSFDIPIQLIEEIHVLCLRRTIFFSRVYCLSYIPFIDIGHVRFAYLHA